jgi:hypothetical protein
VVQKSPPRKKERVVDAVDAKSINDLIEKFGIPAHPFELVRNRLDELIFEVRNMETDIGVSPKGEAIQSSPTKQIKKLKDAAQSIKKAQNQIEEFDAPRQRHLRDRASEFYIPEVGMGELQRALKHTLTEIFSPEFLLRHDIDILKFVAVDDYEDGRPAMRERLPSRHRQLTFDPMALNSALQSQTGQLAGELMKQLSAAFISAASSLEDKRTKGGAAPRPVRDFVLLNIIALWNDAFSRQKPTYFDETYRDLFDFTENVCEILGVPSYCTEHKLKKAISKWKARSSGRKPRLKKAKLSPVTP